MTIEESTQVWVRNVSDERAVAAGSRFDEARGQVVCKWIEQFCKLYEGDFAGQPMKLLPWARDCTMRIFGWVKWSEKWKRWVRRFRQATIFVAKKNSKSTLLAAWAMYLTCGDGEQGAKVFLGAKDGGQARKICGEHAKQMLLQSPELMEVCKINENSMRISHLPTRSYLEPMSSSNSRTQESKEGINGSVCIDELHVVDNDFIRRISRAGISRSEPLQIEVSTAGNNPDSYGRSRYDYAREVESGQRTDPALFVAIYAAPQDLSDEDLKADPMKYGRMANPAMGQTVDPDEYLADFAKSQRNIQDWLDFKMYRLNIWQKGSNPWLPSGAWERCKREFTEDDLLDRPCWAGLDLSRSKDMSCLVLVFPGDEPEEFFLLPYFWLPSERAEELESLGAVREWVAGGWLELTPGGVTDYGYIKARFRELATRFQIQELAYDPHFGEEVTQSLEQGVMDNKGMTLEEGTGIPRFSFAQNDANFAAPTEDFERLVLAGKLLHNGHPVLSWQAGHVQMMRKISKVKRAVKPDRDSRRTVDGVISAIMALGRAMQGAVPRVTCEVW